MSRKDDIFNIGQILNKRRDHLLRALSEDLNPADELNTQKPGDAVDSAMDSICNDLTSKLLEAERRELGCIEQAMELMHNGKFGICHDCGVNIPIARLNALPYAIRCIKCQREAERQCVASDSDNARWILLSDSSGDEEASDSDI